MYNKTNIIILSLMMTILVLGGCSSGGGGDDSATTSTTASLSGVAQKGAFLKDSNVSLCKLDEKMLCTSETLEVKVSDDKGSYEFKALPWSGLSRLSVSGYYFDEVTGTTSLSPATITAVVDIKSNIKQKNNTNILTDLRAKRMKELVDAGKSKEDADRESKEDVKQLFNVGSDDFTALNIVDFSVGKASVNVELLRLSAAIAKSINPVADLEELMKIYNSGGLAAVLESSLYKKLMKDVQEVDVKETLSTMGVSAEDVSSIALSDINISPFVRASVSTVNDNQVQLSLFGTKFTSLDPSIGLSVQGGSLSIVTKTVADDNMSVVLDMNDSSSCKDMNLTFTVEYMDLEGVDAMPLQSNKMAFSNPLTICSENSGETGVPIEVPTNLAPIAIIGMEYLEEEQEEVNITAYVGVRVPGMESSYSHDRDPYPFGGIKSCKWEHNGVVIKESNDVSCDLYNLTFDTAGSYDYILTVTDKQDVEDSNIAHITVLQNTPPVVSITPSSVANIFEGDTLELNATASDVDTGDEVSLLWMYQKVGSSTQYGAGSSTQFSHEFTQAGDYNISVRARDTHNATTIDSIIVSVKEIVIPVNHTPTVSISPSGDKNINIGDSVILKSHASDEDGDDLTISWKLKEQSESTFTSVPLYGATGFNYTFDTIGTYLVVVEVEDGSGAKADANITVSVSDNPNPNPGTTVTLGDLMWEDTAHTRSRSSADMLNWEDALGYCAGLDLEGYTNWRLPHSYNMSGDDWFYDSEVISIRKPALDVNGSEYMGYPGSQLDGDSVTILDSFVPITHNDGIATWTDLANGTTEHIFMIFGYHIENGDGLGSDSKVNVRCVRDMDNSDPQPVFTNKNSVYVSELDTEAITLNAVGGDSMTYSISGGNSSSFTLSASGLVTFNTTPTNDTYTFTAEADNGSKTTSMDIEIRIQHANPALSLELTKANPKNEERFGQAVAIENDIIVVSSYGTHQNNKGNGEVLVYTKTDNGATLVQTITRPDSLSAGRFGETIALKDGFLAIGVPTRSVDAQAHIYKLDTQSNMFEFVQTIDGENNTTNYQYTDNRYAQTIAINENYLVVGVPYQTVEVDGSFTSKAGGAYIYKYSASEGKFSSNGIFISESLSSDYLGDSLTLMDDLILLGSWTRLTQTDGIDNYRGAVVAYKWTGSSFDKVYTINAATNPNGENSGRFSSSLAVDGDYLAVGEKDRDIDSADNVGSVSIFKRVSGTDNFEIFRYIPNPAPTQNDVFGRSLALKHPYVIVGERTKMSVLKYSDNNYSKVGEYAITPIDKYRADDYGEEAYVASIAVSNDTVIAGIPQAMSFTKVNTKATNSGRAYLLDLSPTRPYWVDYKRAITLSEKKYSIKHEFRGRAFSTSVSGTDGSQFSVNDIYLTKDNRFTYDTPADADENNKYEMNLVLNAGGVDYSYPFTWEVQDSLNITQGYNDGMSNAAIDYNRIKVNGSGFYYTPTVVMQNSKVYIGSREGSSSYSSPNYITIATVNDTTTEYISYSNKIGVDDVTDVNVTSKQFMPNTSYDVEGSLLAVDGACFEDATTEFTSCYIHLFDDLGVYSESLLTSKNNTTSNESAKYVSVDEGRLITQYALNYGKVSLQIYSKDAGAYTIAQTIPTEATYAGKATVSTDNGFMSVNTYTDDKKVRVYKYNNSSEQYELFQTITLQDNLAIANASVENAYLLIERYQTSDYDLSTDIYRLSSDASTFEVVQSIANADAGSTVYVSTRKQYHQGVKVVTNSSGTYLLKKFSKRLEADDVKYNATNISISNYIAIFKLDAVTDQFRFVQSFTKKLGSPDFANSFDVEGDTIISNSDYLHTFKFSE